MAEDCPGDLNIGQDLGSPLRTGHIEAVKSEQEITNQESKFFVAASKTVNMQSKDMSPLHEFSVDHSRTSDELKKKAFMNEKQDTQFKPKPRQKRKKIANLNEKPERSRSGRIIKRKKFSSGSEVSEESEDSTYERFYEYSDDSVKSELISSSDNDTTKISIYKSENKDVEEISSVQEIEKSNKKKDIKNNKSNAKKKAELDFEERRKFEQMNELLQKQEDENKILTKLSIINKKIKQSLTYNNPDIQASLDAMTELQNLPLNAAILKKNPDVLVTLKKCRKFKKNEFVRQKAEYLFNNFKMNAHCLDRAEKVEPILSDLDIKDTNFQVQNGQRTKNQPPSQKGKVRCQNKCFGECENILEEFFQNMNGHCDKGYERKNLAVANHHCQNGTNNKVIPERLKKNNPETIEKHQNGNEDRDLNAEFEANSSTSTTDLSTDIVALLSSSIAVMKSLENKNESMEDAFGNFVAHQMKTFSDPVLKDRVMSRIVSLIMEEKYE